MEDSDLIEMKRVLEIEAQAILGLNSKNFETFGKAVQILLECTGKVIVTGMGKSGHIARKIAATLSSTGTPSVFLHPAESSHGDLGVVAPTDIVIAISYGGESKELAAVLNYCGRKNIAVIGMTGNLQSSLAEFSSSVLDISVEREACPLNLAPTASSTATLALGDALAMALLKRRGFKEENFGEYHPGGSLGRKLLLRVSDLMHTGGELPLVFPTAKLRDVISVMTSKDVRGVAGVINEAGELLGVITDGDIRRRLKKTDNPLNDQASDLMSLKPKTIDCSELAERALFVMEQFSIQTLFVLDETGALPRQPVGLLHFQDLLKAKIR